MNKIQIYSLVGVVVVALFFAMIIGSSPKDTGSVVSGEKSNEKRHVSAEQEKRENEMYPGIVRAHSLWVENSRYLYDYKDGFYSGDNEFLLQQVREGKIFFAEKSAGVICKGKYKQGEIIRIRFFEGRYKNKSGYIFCDFVQRIKG